MTYLAWNIIDQVFKGNTFGFDQPDLGQSGIKLVELSDSYPIGIYGSPLTIHWASGPLAAGSHQVRLLVDDHPTESGGGSAHTGCIGSADNDGYQARLLVKWMVIKRLEYRIKDRLYVPEVNCPSHHLIQRSAQV